MADMWADERLSSETAGLDVVAFLRPIRLCEIRGTFAQKHQGGALQLPSAACVCVCGTRQRQLACLKKDRGKEGSMAE